MDTAATRTKATRPKRKQAKPRVKREARTSRSLREYQRKRNFEVTAEPSGQAAGETSARRDQAPQFVIQKHAARNLHYDFRLELDGVLLSWSVPKGPSLAPKTRRLAMRTEDHPLDYAGFEGIIPKGEYGGGTVVVWDRGTWTPEGDARDGLKKGRLTFELHGEKLRGRWHLVRTKGESGKEAWLLFKSRDAEASDTRDIVEELPASVVTGRTVEQVASDGDRVWHSNRDTRHPEREPSPGLHELVRELPVRFKFTNLDRVLYPEQNITKAQLVAYLAIAREFLLPHVLNRPLTLVRCPTGIVKRAAGGSPAEAVRQHDKHCFFQKHAGDGMPDALRRIPIMEENGERAEYMMIEDFEGLLATAQMGTLELHTWGSHYPKVERPDVMVFDIDPDPDLAWNAVAHAAIDVKNRLADLGIESFVKTTGGKGLHVVAPCAPRLDWDTFKEFTKAFVIAMEKDDPSRYTSNMSKAKRRGKVFLDYLRNGRGATFVAPYSARARDNAPVAVPITWEELVAGVEPQKWNVLTVPQRLESLKTDPWEGYFDLKQSVSAAALKKLGVR